MKPTIENARFVVANLDEKDRRTLTKEITGRDAPRATFRNFRTCKYCGGIIHGKGVGLHGAYCQRSCWTGVEGFDCELNHETLHGVKKSIEVIEDGVARAKKEAENSFQRGERRFKEKEEPTLENIPATDNTMETIYNNLGEPAAAVKPKLELVEVLQRSKDIHPLLPSIIAMLADGEKQTEIARKLKISQSIVSESIKSLRATYDY